MLTATYDGLARRRQAITLAATKSYLFDGSIPVRLASALDVQERLTAGAEMLTYSSTPSGQGTTSWVPLLDGNGSSIAHVDSTGNLFNQHTYDPSGLTTSSGGTVNDPFLFSGMEQDVTGLYYSGGRYQSPGLSRSISEISPQTSGGSGGGTTGPASGPSGSSGSSGSPFGFQPGNAGVEAGAGASAGLIVSGIAAQAAFAAAGGVGAEGAAAAASAAFSSAWITGGGAVLPALGPAGWAALAAIVVADVLLEVLDPFGSGAPPVNHKRYEPGHTVQEALLGIDGKVIMTQARIVLVGDTQTPTSTPTPDCSEYAKACSKCGRRYDCSQAPLVCGAAPISGYFGRWSNCSRACLQGRRAEELQNGCGAGYPKLFTDHLKCLPGCM